MALEQAPFDEEGVEVAGRVLFVEGRPDGDPTPAARDDAQVLQPVGALGARVEREGLVERVVLVPAVAHVRLGVEQRGGAAVGARGRRGQQGEEKRLTGKMS